MFANQEIRYQTQPSPLTACTPYPAFPQGPALPLPHPQRETRSKTQQPRSLTLPSQGVPGRGRELGAPARLPPARPPAPAHPRAWGEMRREKEDEGCGQREGTASTPPGYGRTERGSLPVSLSTAR